MLYLHLFSYFFHFRLYSTSRISDIAVPRFIIFEVYTDRKYENAYEVRVVFNFFCGYSSCKRTSTNKYYRYEFFI